MKKKLENQKGITLLALVITIVVLLIIAGISISMLTGENGTIAQAGNAKLLNEIGTIKEAIDMRDVEKQEDDSYNKRQAFGSITDVLGEEYKKYDKKYAIEAGNIVYKDNKFSEKDIKILEENGIEKESKHYLIMNETTKQSKYEGREEAITLKELQDKIKRKEFSGEEGKYNKAYIIEDLDLGSKWDKEGILVSGEQWVPITEIPENTTIDGCNFSINGLYISNEKQNQGLINTNQGLIKDLTLDKDCWICGTSCVAALCVTNSSTGEIIRCKNLSNIEGTGWHHAGICVYNYGTICECMNYGDLKKGACNGGVCGFGYDGSKITLCSNFGNVISEDDQCDGGGIMGNGGGLVDKCLNYGKGFAGGIVGVAGYYPYKNATNLQIVSCANFGEVNNGIVNNSHTQFIESYSVENCYNFGNVYYGGIVGNLANIGTIENCYNIGKNIKNGATLEYKLVWGNTNGIIKNSYCLNEKLEDGTIIDENFMKSQKFIDMLNTDAETGEKTDIYTMDTKGINNGFPILKWQLEN